MKKKIRTWRVAGDHVVTSYLLPVLLASTSRMYSVRTRLAVGRHSDIAHKRDPEHSVCVLQPACYRLLVLRIVVIGPQIRPWAPIVQHPLSCVFFFFPFRRLSRPFTRLLACPRARKMPTCPLMPTLPTVLFPFFLNIFTGM